MDFYRDKYIGIPILRMAQALPVFEISLVGIAPVNIIIIIIIIEKVMRSVDSFHTPSPWYVISSEWQLIKELSYMNKIMIGVPSRSSDVYF